MSAIALRREPPRTGDNGSAYIVFADDERVGSVAQYTVTHDRKPPGSRIVTRRTQSLRWFAVPSGGWDWTDTRWESVAIVLAAVFGGSPASHHDAARAATVERTVS